MYISLGSLFLERSSSLSSSYYYLFVHFLVIDLSFPPSLRFYVSLLKFSREFSVLCSVYSSSSSPPPSPRAPFNQRQFLAAELSEEAERSRSCQRSAKRRRKGEEREESEVERSTSLVELNPLNRF